MAGEGKPRPPIALSSTDVRDSKVSKIVLSSGPLSDDFIATAVRLAYCRVGDTKWCDLVESEETKTRKYSDVTFLGGKLHTVSVEGETMVCDDIRSCPRLRECKSIADMG